MSLLLALLDAGGITANAIGAFDLTGQSTAAVEISAAGSSGFEITGSAAGNPTATASASSVFGITGEGQGEAFIAGESSGAFNFVSDSTVAVALAAECSGSFNFTGRASDGFLFRNPTAGRPVLVTENGRMVEPAYRRPVAASSVRRPTQYSATRPRAISVGGR